MLKKLLAATLWTLLAFPVAGALAQTGTVSGTVTDSTTGDPVPGVNVIVQGTQVGAATGAEGTFEVSSVPAGTQTLVASFIGYDDKEVPVTVQAGQTTNVNISLPPSTVALENVVVTALGVERSERSLSYSSQQVDAQELNVTQDVNIKTALAGKVSGVQINGQAGSKLGASGGIRIRGALSLTSATSDPLYVIDGVPSGSDANVVNMANVKAINVLKGPKPPRSTGSAEKTASC